MEPPLVTIHNVHLHACHIETYPNGYLIRVDMSNPSTPRVVLIPTSGDEKTIIYTLSNPESSRSAFALVEKATNPNTARTLFKQIQDCRNSTCSDPNRHL